MTQITLLPVSNLFHTLFCIYFVQTCQRCQLCVLRENPNVESPMLPYGTDNVVHCLTFQDTVMYVDKSETRLCQMVGFKLLKNSLSQRSQINCTGEHYKSDTSTLRKLSQ